MTSSSPRDFSSSGPGGHQAGHQAAHQAGHQVDQRGDRGAPAGPPGAQGPSAGREPTESGEPLQQAWLLSGRLVAGVGQLLLWIINGAGRLLQPLTVRIVTRLNGRRPPQSPQYPNHPPYPNHPQSPPHSGYQQPPLGPVTDAPLPRWIQAWRESTRSWWFAPLTGLALAVAALAELSPRDGSPVSVAGGFVVASTLPLIWRREFLRPVAAVVLGAFAASLLSGQRPLVMTAFAALYTLFLLAQNLPRQSAGVMAVGSVASTVVVYLASGGLDDIPFVVSILAVLAAIGLGDARRVVETAERTNAEAKERTSETLTRLSLAQREQAVLRERTRIARELHDVVAHSVSMIAVQAETAPYTMRDLSDEAREGYAEIARTAREALVEMRRLLGVLRSDAPSEPEVSPQPRLDRLPDLLEQHKSAGGNADLVVRGSARSLSATVELSAYRIVQEALTNARRHAPGAQVQVELSFLPDRLAVRVRDDGAAAQTMVLDPGRPVPTAPTGPEGGTGGHTLLLPPGGAAGTRPPAGSYGPAAPVGPIEPIEPGGPGGHGLVGMQERATMLGGRFSAGPATQGGFVVEAELPFDREESHRS